MARTINEDLRQQKRAAIYAAAENLFAANGFAFTTISSIAKEAKVSHATVFTYFPSKEDLIYAVVLEPLRKSQQNYELIISENNPPGETIKNLIKEQFRIGIHRGTYLRLVQQVLGQPEQYPELTRSLMEYGEMFVNMLEPLILKGQASGELDKGDPKVIGWTFFAYFNGSGLIFLDSDSSFIQHTVEYAMRIFGFRTP